MTDNDQQTEVPPGPQGRPSSALTRGWAALKTDIGRMLNTGVFHVLVLVVGMRGMTFIQQVALTKILDPSILDQAIYILRLINLLAIAADLGMCTSVLKYAAEEPSEAAQRDIYRTGVLYSALSGTIFALLYTAVILITSAAGHAPELQRPMLFTAMYLPLVAVSRIPPLFLQARKQIRRASKLSLVTNVLGLGFVVGGASWLGLWGYLAAMVLTPASALIIFLWATGDLLRRARTSWRLFLKLARFGFFSLLANFSGYANATASIFLLRALREAGDGPTVAVFGVANLVAMGLRMLPQSLLQTAFPYMSGLKDRPEALQARVHEMARKQVLVMGALMAGVVLFGYWGIPFLTRPYYTASYIPAILLTGAIVAWSAGAPFGHALLVLDRVRTNFLVALAQLIANIALAIVMIPAWGASGAALALLCSSLVSFAGSIFFGKRVLRHHQRSHSTSLGGESGESVGQGE